MMNKKYAMSVLLLASGLMSGCESSDLSGSWAISAQGVWTEPGPTDHAFAPALTLEITQDGDEIDGVWEDSVGRKGYVTGTVSGGEISDFTMTDYGYEYLTDICRGDMTGTLTLDGHLYSGTISASPACGNLEASVRMLKVPSGVL
jgi:hypothetical protein